MVRSGLVHLCVGLLVLANAPPAAPDALTLTVNNVFDVAADFSNDPDYSVCHTSPSNSVCTLRAAIMNANRHPGGATIIVPSQTCVLSLAPAGSDDDASGDLNITGAVTLQSAAAATTIVDGAALDRVVTIEADGVVTIAGLTIQNGDGGQTGSGGGIDNFGQLTLSDSTVSGNRAGLGGGIFNEAGAVLLVRGSSIRANIAVLNSGGGIENMGLLTLENSTVNSNRALVGGGLSTRNPGSLTVVNSTISGNGVTGSGGGVFAGGPTVFYGTTIAGNLADSAGTAAGYGGGLYASVNGYAHAWNSLFAFNYVANEDNTCQGSNLTSDDYNYFQTTSGCTIAGTATHDVFGEPLLGPLADNGGGTRTRALWAGSEALDRIPSARCRDQFGAAPVPDQRGVARPVGALCDIGAFEGAQDQPIFSSNLVQNGDAEAAAGSPAGAFVGTPYWTADTGQFTAVPYDSPGGFPSVTTDVVPSAHGDNFFSGGAAASSTGFQYINLASAGDVIDNGGVFYSLSADLGGYLDQGDHATFTVTFLDGAASVIGDPVTLGPVGPGERNDQTGFVHESTTDLLPVGTRLVLAVVTMNAGPGYNDGYADNLSLVLTPEPSSALAAAASLCALARLARRGPKNKRAL